MSDEKAQMPGDGDEDMAKTQVRRSAAKRANGGQLPPSGAPVQPQQKRDEQDQNGERNAAERQAEAEKVEQAGNGRDELLNSGFAQNVPAQWDDSGANTIPAQYGDGSDSDRSDGNK